MDDHDDKVTDLFNCLACLVILEEHEIKVRLDPQQHLPRRLYKVEQNLRNIAATVSSAADQPEVDRSLLEQ